MRARVERIEEVRADLQIRRAGIEEGRRRSKLVVMGDAALNQEDLVKFIVVSKAGKYNAPPPIVEIGAGAAGVFAARKGCRSCARAFRKGRRPRS